MPCRALLRSLAPALLNTGKGCQKVQKAISDLCYQDSFAADAVLMRKPIRGKSSSGRAFVFPPTGSAGKRGRRGRESSFVKKRNDLVEHQFIPRCDVLHR